MKLYWVLPLFVLAACQPNLEIEISSDAESEAESSEEEMEYMPSTSAEDAVVYLIMPEDGAVIPAGELKVKFGLSGMGVAPAGVKFPNSGHHHLLVNAAEMPPMDMPIPTDSAHLHFGLGQTETTLELSPGNYTLQLVLGDLSHIPHDPPVVSKPVTITVE